LLVAAKPAPAQVSAPLPAPVASEPAPPQPQVKPPPPRPKPVSKPEKPVVKKLEKLKPAPVPKPRPEPEEESDSSPAPQPEAPSAPAPAPPAPTQAPASRSAPKAAGESAENTRFSQGTVGGYRTAYPAVARERGWEGTATVRIHVSAEGEIEDVSIVSSSGHGLLDEYAIEAVKGARHVKPCHRGDKPVDCTFTQPFQFKLTKE
jgi:protein TonB